ncbi:MAG: hypothetical protein MR424_00885 [Treponema sp.]|nr:hypothetical protein [Treponema sp.]MCI7565717.1 hypothetical protein [Treponema sp.]
MTIEGYFDGTAVRTLEPVDLKPNQRVLSAFWTMIILTQKKQRIQENLDSINSVYGMLSPEESKAVEDSVHAGTKIGEVIAF